MTRTKRIHPARPAGGREVPMVDLRRHLLGDARGVLVPQHREHGVRTALA